MNNALATRPTMQDQLAQAEWFCKSGFMPKHFDTPAKVYAAITLGQELGLAPWAALNNIFVIGGKPSINANLMLSLIQSSGAMTGFDVEATNDSATVTMARRGVGTYSSTFTMEDAKRAGLLSGTNSRMWTNYPKAMLKARAIADAARTLFADVLLGMYTPDELGAAVTVDAATGEITVLAEPPAPQHEDPEPPPALPDPAKWTQAQAGSFNLEAKRLGVTPAEALGVLGVAKLSEYTPGFSAAREMLNAYAAARPVAQPEPEDLTDMQPATLL